MNQSTTRPGRATIPLVSDDARLPRRTTPRPLLDTVMDAYSDPLNSNAGTSLVDLASGGYDLPSFLLPEPAATTVVPPLPRVRLAPTTGASPAAVEPLPALGTAPWTEADLNDPAAAAADPNAFPLPDFLSRLHPVPDAPRARVVVAPPVRDLRAERKAEQKAALIGAGVPLIAGLLGGGVQALGAVPGAARGSMAEARFENDRSFQNALNAWQGTEQTADRQAGEDWQAWRGDVQATSAYNGNVETAARLESAAAARQAQEQARRDGLTEKQREAEAAAAAKRSQNVVRALNYLKGLQTDDDRQAALASGVLKSVFELDDDGMAQLASVQGFQKQTGKTDEQRAKDNALSLARQQYKLFENPRLPAADAKKILGHIDTLQQMAGLPAGMVPDGVLEELTPEAKGRLGIAQQNANTNTANVNSQITTRAQQLTLAQQRVTQGDERIKQAEKRAGQIGKIKDPSTRIFALTKERQRLAAGLEMQPVPPISPGETDPAKIAAAEALQTRTTQQRAYYQRRIDATDAEIARLQGKPSPVVGGSLGDVRHQERYMASGPVLPAPLATNRPLTPAQAARIDQQMRENGARPVAAPTATPSPAPRTNTPRTNTAPRASARVNLSAMSDAELKTHFAKKLLGSK